MNARKSSVVAQLNRKILKNIREKLSNIKDICLSMRFSKGTSLPLKRRFNIQDINGSLKALTKKFRHSPDLYPCIQCYSLSVF